MRTARSGDPVPDVRTDGRRETVEGGHATTPDDGAHATTSDARRGDAPEPAPHPTSVVVWGVPSPVVANRRFVAKAGVKCAAGCPLSGRLVVVRNEAGADVGHGRLGEAPEPGTSALYAAEVTLDAPAVEGVHAWTAAFDGAGPDPAPYGTGVPGQRAAPTHTADSVRDTLPAHEADPVREAAPAQGALPKSGRTQPQEAVPVHASAAATFGFRTVRPPEHRVMVTVRHRDTEAPVAGAEVRVGIYRGRTGADGQAAIDVRAGSYALYVRKAGCAPHNDTVAVSGLLTLHVTLESVSDTDTDEDQIWM